MSIVLYINILHVPENTLLENDIKNLKATTGLSSKISFVAVCILLVVLTACGSINLYRSHQYAKMAGTSLYGIFGEDTSGFDISKEYSGAYVKALDRYVTGLFQVLLVPLIVVYFILFWKRRKRNMRLLKFIEGARNIEHDC